LHDLANAALDELYASGRVEFVTSDFILAEVLTFFSRHGPRQRVLALELVRKLLAEEAIICVPASHDLVERSIRHYASRIDKPYSLTDCSSMVICGDLRIRDVLTHDRDFEQEGLTIRL
jgi:predicted nucleic acid-binding protein